MNKFQIEILANFLTNIAIAWFAAGVIAPLFTKHSSLYEMILSIILGICFSGAFVLLSMAVIMDNKHE